MRPRNLANLILLALFAFMAMQPSDLCASLLTLSSEAETEFSLLRNATGERPADDAELPERVEPDYGTHPAMTGLSTLDFSASGGMTGITSRSEMSLLPATGGTWLRFCECLLWPPQPHRSLLKIPIAG